MRPLPSWTIWLLATACGMLIANLYFAQPIADLIGAEFAIERSHLGLLSTLPLTGYGTGLLVIAPLGDLLENRRLIVVMTASESAALLVLSAADREALFLFAGFGVGLAASTIQVIMPYVSHMLPSARQGAAVARLVSGMMLGILLARPVSSFIAEVMPWRSVYLIAGSLMAAMTPALLIALPPRRPTGASNYANLMLSLVEIFRETPILRRRAAYHAAMFGAFITFWTAVPLWLAGPPFHLTQAGIAWVALAGVAGAVTPPFAVRLADAGHGRTGTAVAMAIAILAFLMTLAAKQVWVVVLAGILLDGAVSANLVFGQRAIYALAPAQRGRMNALYIAFFFAGGALASAAAAWSYAHLGWPGVVGFGAALPVAALLYSATDRINSP